MPWTRRPDIGPVAKAEILLSLNAQLSDAKSKGAVIEYAGQRPEPGSRGLFFAPCVVYNPTRDMKVLTEEVLGPIAPVVVVKDDDEAVAAANDTQFGLGASILSRDTERAERIALKLEAGIVAINDMVRSDPRLPFGGIKKSGFGRELSHYGIREFVNIKSVVVR
ncbi:MAG TPA: aldehyde dehydrogenase family protein [Dissulfurispiraceae bacterium]|nr:aldehyde dehydrogenase family protein [Dissulfurispiraceae bacterium]